MKKSLAHTIGMGLKKNKFVYKSLHTLWIGINQVPVRILGFLREKGIFLNDNYKELLKYQNCHKGERCFLVANGPSLTISDLELIQNEYSIACNKIYYLFGETTWRPNYYCILDEDYIEQYQDEIFSKLDFPIFTNDVIAKRISTENKKGKKIIYSKQIIYKDFKAWSNLLKYTYATKQGTIMSYCMAVALYMGFSEIYIIGMDNSSTTSGKHFAGYKEDPSLQKRLKTRVKENGWSTNHWKDQTELEMNEFKKYADENGVRIFNATRGGELNVFPRVNLDEYFR